MLGALAGRVWASPGKPKLTVLVVAEQLRADALDAAWPQLGAGGFRRLAEKGAWFTGCRQVSSTFSACGIANLATGAWPAQHGIVADSWWDYAAHGPVRASDEALLATTLAAQAADARGCGWTVVAMTAGARRSVRRDPGGAAVFLGRAGAVHHAGRGARHGCASTTSAKGPESARDANWMAVNAAAGAPPLRTLHYDTNHPREFLALYRASPFGQAAVFDIAAEAGERGTILGQRRPRTCCA